MLDRAFIRVSAARLLIARLLELVQLECSSKCLNEKLSLFPILLKYRSAVRFFANQINTRVLFLIGIVNDAAGFMCKFI